MKVGNRFFEKVIIWLLILFASGMERLVAAAGAESASNSQSPKRIWVDPVQGSEFGERGNRNKPFNEIGSIIVTGKAFTTNGALSVARPGDTIILTAGHFTNNSSIWCVPGVKIQGAGIKRTFVYATNCNEYGLGGPVVVLSSGSICRDFTIVCSTNTAQAGIGTDHRGSYSYAYRLLNDGQWERQSGVIHPAAFTNALVQRVKVATGRDCVYVLHTNTCSVTFKDCIFEGNWDGGILFGNSESVLDFRRCKFQVDGSLPADLERNYVDGFLVELGTANFSHCQIIAINGPTHSFGIRNLQGTVNASHSKVVAFGSPNTSHYGSTDDSPVNLHRTEAYTTIRVTVNGAGSVKPDYNGRLLKLGEKIQLYPAAAPGAVWTGWTGDDGSGGGVCSQCTTFTVQPNIELEANFIAAPTATAPSRNP